MKFKILFLGLLLLLFTSQAFAITDTNLVAYYKLDEASGNALDSFGDLDLTQNGTIGTTAGKIETARGDWTTGSTRHFGLDSFFTGGINGRTEASFCAWVKRASTLTNDLCFIFEIGVHGTNTIRGAIQKQNNMLFVEHRVGNTSTQATVDNFTSTEWNFICGTFKDGYAKLYLNGVLQDTSAQTSGTGTTASGNFDLGTHNGSHYNWEGALDEVSVFTKELTVQEITELYNSGNGLTYPFVTEYINVDYNYVVRKDLNKVILKDTSTVSGVTKTAWTWTNNGSTISTAQDYNLTATELTDYNICLHVDTNVSDVNGDKCYSFNTGDWTPPVTTFSSFQVPNTTDQNITLTCTDNNSGCKYINYNIDNNMWVLYSANRIDVNKNIDYNLVLSNVGCLNTTYSLRRTDTFTTKADQNKLLSNLGLYVEMEASRIGTWYLKVYYVDGTTTDTEALTFSGGRVSTLIQFSTFNKTKDFNKIEIYAKSNYSSPCADTYTNSLAYRYDTNTKNNYPNYSFLKSGAGSHSIQYFSTDNSDNNETIKTSTFTTYGNARFTIKDQNSGLDLNGTQINFNGSDYVSGSNIYDFNLQELTATNTSYLFTISKTGYATRYYQIDLNYFSSFDINFALLPDSLDADVPFKVYETDETTLFTNTYVEVKDSDTNWTVGRLKTNSIGEATFNLRTDDSNYNAIINNGEFTYTPVAVSVLYPKNEETLVQITEKWKIEITQNLYASYSDLNATKIIYLLPNTSLPYNIKISDMNGNYFPRTYAKTYPGNPLTDTLQPYLVSESTGLLTTINSISATTNQPLEGITFKVYKYISGLGRTFVEQLTTDSKGQALSLLVLGDSYEFEAYNGSVLLKNFPITATSSTIFFVLSLGSEVITQPGNSGFSSKFTPGNIINLETIGSQGFSQTLYNFGNKNITITSTITQNGANLSAPQNYSGSSDKTFTYTVAWASIVKGTIIQKMVVTTSDGNVYTFDQNIQVIESYGTGYNPLDGLQNGLRSDLVCSSDPLVPCYPLLVLAFLICVAVTIWATVQFGVYGGQSAGLIFLVGMILFTYLTWIPVWITAGLVLIILAFIVNERR